MSMTTENFWDCDCRDFYIHPASDTHCPKCHATRDEWHPDSHIREVKDGTHFFRR